jgi:hypothetical protein
MHGAQLCELLPVGIPTLVEQVSYIRDWDAKTPKVDLKEVDVSLYNIYTTH